MAFFELRWFYYLFGQVWIWCRRKRMWAFYPFERLVFKNVLKIILINIWIFIPLLIYMWGVEGVTYGTNNDVWILNHNGRFTAAISEDHGLQWRRKKISDFGLQKKKEKNQDKKEKTLWFMLCWNCYKFLEYS